MAGRQRERVVAVVRRDYGGRVRAIVDDPIAGVGLGRISV